eukprot:7300836-Pyramimonas_sp.AAC.1
MRYGDYGQSERTNPKATQPSEIEGITMPAWVRRVFIVGTGCGFNLIAERILQALKRLIESGSCSLAWP